VDLRLPSKYGAIVLISRCFEGPALPSSVFAGIFRGNVNSNVLEMFWVVERVNE
jgi:hypothetical protein